MTIVWIGDAPKRFGEACFGQPWQRLHSVHNLRLFFITLTRLHHPDDRACTVDEYATYRIADVKCISNIAACVVVV